MHNMHPSIAINARYSSRRITGVERYAHEVTSCLLARNTEPRLLSLKPDRRVQGLAGHIWEQFFLPQKLKELDLLWSPANTGPLAVDRQVVVIHDLSAIEHPEWFKPSFALWYQFLLPRLVRRVRRVIVNSQFTKQRVLEVCRVPETQVVMIPGGVNRDHFRPRPPEEILRVCKKYGISGDYLLTVGTIEERKNHASLFRAWEGIASRHKKLALVVAGDEGKVFRNNQLPVPPQGVKLVGYVEDQDLPAIYSGAQALLFISLYEGFGLPILEAMSCGVPVIASHTSAIPEVVGDAGMFVELNAPEEIESRIEMLLADPAQRQGLIQKGLNRAREFSWTRTAEAIWQVLEQAIG
jgi:glycosyltransferase involved in cell wall biosynthesis